MRRTEQKSEKARSRAGDPGTEAAAAVLCRAAAAAVDSQCEDGEQ